MFIVITTRKGDTDAIKATCKVICNKFGTGYMEIIPVRNQKDKYPYYLIISLLIPKQSPADESYTQLGIMLGQLNTGVTIVPS